MRFANGVLRMTKKNNHNSYTGIMAKTGLTINPDIAPLTPRQKKAFRAQSESRNIIMNGFPGTGKTFLAIYFALLDVADKNSPIDSIVIIRPPVSTHDQGFLPGNEEEKMEPYIKAYIEICNMIFGRGDAYGILKKYSIISVESTSFLRSRTLDNTAYILDEMQNCNFHECDTFITRAGQNTKLYLAGDYYQSDLKGYDKNGILEFLDIITEMVEDFETIEFEVDDCVRSDLVKRYLMKKVEKQRAKMRRETERMREQERNIAQLNPVHQGRIICA
jgi:phosphate starvation-inducible protein PhoH